MKNNTVSRSSEFFDLNRFWKYFVADIQDCANRYGLSMLLLCVALPLCYLVGLTFRLLMHSNPVGFQLPFRLMIAGMAALIMFISSPSICYGYITDKKMGTRFLMLPASTFEKFLSMIVICCVIIPLIFMIGTFISDSIICLIDPNSGTSFAEALAANELREAILAMPLSINVMQLVGVFMNEIMTSSLLFLLGAIWFRRGKISKTIGMLILFAILISMLTAVVFTTQVNEAFLQKALINTQNHPVLSATLPDMVLNLIVAGLIYLRLKKISH